MDGRSCRRVAGIAAVLLTLAGVACAQESPPFVFVSSGIAGSHPGVTVGADPSGTLMVGDDGSGSFVVYDPLITTFSLWGGRGTPQGPFGNLRDIAFTRSGDFFVLESAQVRHFDSARNQLSIFGSSGSEPGQFVSPSAVATDDLGNAYVADAPTGRIQKFSSEGLWLQQWIVPGTIPLGVAVDHFGRVFFSDGAGDRIWSFSASGALLHVWGGTGSEPGQFNIPTAVSIDDAGNVYVLDSINRRIEKFLIDGTVVAIISWSIGSAALDMVAAPRGRIYVVGNSGGSNGFIQGLQYLATPNIATSWGRVKALYR